MEDIMKQLTTLFYSYSPDNRTRKLVKEFPHASMELEMMALLDGWCGGMASPDPVCLSGLVLETGTREALWSVGYGNTETALNTIVDKLKTHTLDFEAWAEPIWKNPAGGPGNLAPLIARSCAALVTGKELELEPVDKEALKASIEAIIPPTP